MVFVD